VTRGAGGSTRGQGVGGVGGASLLFASTGGFGGATTGGAGAGGGATVAAARARLAAERSRWRELVEAGEPRASAAAAKSADEAVALLVRSRPGPRAE
jgi:hypothetical protein